MLKAEEVATNSVGGGAETMSVVVEGAGVKVDGRRLRAVRTRDAIVSAVVDLVTEEESAPTAQRIADRAGVSVRSVYQHFSEIDELFIQASARLYARVVEPTGVVDLSMPLEGRVAAFVGMRCRIFAGVTAFNRVSQSVEQSSAAVRKHRLDLLRREHEELVQTFAPEFAELEADDRELVIGVLDALSVWSTWDHMRSSGLSATAARRAISQTMLVVLRAAGDPH